ncbi:unnamed protein product [Clonostachys byssicola]|uniref:Uncharacterized protein n=1 Tax=Clonostachys byssicola TaxID=160290 RepID=A0A9N9XX35_9HYPO|nr:unnamed protein product [Clonostachys byssicola]
MVGVKQLSLAAVLWLGLASRRFALEIDETNNDLNLALWLDIILVSKLATSTGILILEIRDEDADLEARDDLVW